MRRRREPDRGVPSWVRELDPERYREAAEERLSVRPGDTRGAAMAVWRAFVAERGQWRRQQGARRYVDGRDTWGTPRPPFSWVQEEFGTDAPRWPS